MGFPTWTLWGMGITAVFGLIMIALAYVAQSPPLQARLGIAPGRLDYQARSLTGYAFALLILFLAFFLAGVPIETETAVVTPEAEVVVATATSGAIQSGAFTQPTAATTGITVTASPTTTTQGGASGAFGELPQPTSPITGTQTGSDAAAIVTPQPTNTPQSSAATVTPTATATVIPTNTPTVTPSPTLTPTPILGKTAVVSTGGSTLSVRRFPGGPTLQIISDTTTVIILSGHANQAGMLWQQISTVEGTIGWVQADFLDFGDGE